jgi:hypothetical protein
MSPLALFDSPQSGFVLSFPEWLRSRVSWLQSREGASPNDPEILVREPLPENPSSPQESDPTPKVASFRHFPNGFVPTCRPSPRPLRQGKHGNLPANPQKRTQFRRSERLDSHAIRSWIYSDGARMGHHSFSLNFEGSRYSLNCPVSAKI